jgi:hypothetical protein
MICKDLEHVGNDKKRLTIWNPREIVFAQQWDKENKDHNILCLLLLKNPNHFSRTLASPRDMFVAATVIQWLGTNVGQGFLETTQKEIERTKEKYKAAQQASYRLRGFPVTAEQSNAVLKK